MQILSMTATFGKLENQALTLTPGLNILEKPNEWGKSTWCAFLIAMLYGIDTGERTTKTSLAAKSHYAPWSGAAMTGRMDLLWNGRKITIERSSKGKNPFNVFRAYETDTGLEIAELTAENCGQTLLGVERSVFQRAGFLKLTDLPVGQDEALRRRLNALVTTGDESDTGDTLQKSLKDLKNHCRFNKKGLLPQAEAQRDEVLRALQELSSLQAQKQQHIALQQTLTQQYQDLENHLQALIYNANLTHSQKLASAQLARDNAENALAQADAACKDLPDPQALQDTLNQLDRLLQSRSNLQFRAHTAPPPPTAPVDAEVFRGMAPEQAVAMAEQDTQKADFLQKESLKFPYLGLGLAIAGGVLAAAVPPIAVKIGGIAAAIVGVVLLAAQLSKKKTLTQELSALQAKYRGAPSTTWEESARRFAAEHNAYAEELQQHQESLQALNADFEENDRQIAALTGGVPYTQFQQDAAAVFQKFRAQKDAREQWERAGELVTALISSHKEVASPKYPDTLTHSEADTRRLLTDTQLKIQQLKELVGKFQGQMVSYGDETVLQKQLAELSSRIEKLEDTYAALEIGLSALEAATQELQRRFAPRISQRAQELLGRMTGGRYTRLTLDSTFNVYTATTEEVIPQTALWRSDGTADQLYLALRLAVAEELTPEAPLVLDDALVRFDDTRLAAALEILRETANDKQVILFTCQNRENNLAH